MTGDPCCWLCKTPSGVCATGRQCDHHKANRAELEPSRITYRDPTGNTAAGNVDRERNPRRRRRKET